MQQEDDADQRHDHALLEQRMLERVDRRIDQVGAVIDRDDFGRLLATSEIRFLTFPITSSALTPKRCSTMPLATSPSPLSSVMPRRSSGPSSTRATSRSSTGVPPFTFSTMLPRSLIPLR